MRRDETTREERREKRRGEIREENRRNTREDTGRVEEKKRDKWIQEEKR